MRKKVMAVLTAAAAALAPALAAGSSASAANVQCTPVAGNLYIYVTKGTTNYYVAAPNNNTPGSHPEFKSFAGNVPNDTAAFVVCKPSSGNSFALEHIAKGVTTALSNDAANNNTVDLDQVLSGAPNPSMYWTQSQSGSTFQIRDTLTGRYLRVPNKGVAQYVQVVAGNNPTNWFESH
jgi:hypothetical protein